MTVSCIQIGSSHRLVAYRIGILVLVTDYDGRLTSLHALREGETGRGSLFITAEDPCEATGTGEHENKKLKPRSFLGRQGYRFACAKCGKAKR